MPISVNDYPKYMTPKEMMRLEHYVYEEYGSPFKVEKVVRQGPRLQVSVLINKGRKTVTVNL